MEKEKSWTEGFRILSPILLLSLNLLAGILISNQKTMTDGITEIDQKLFHHLTNDEMHTPRSLVVEKVEYMAVQKMRDKQFEQLFSMLEKLQESVDYHIQNLNKNFK
jgi:hypothetical protein